jgi:hypothetical protein
VGKAGHGGLMLVTRMENRIRLGYSRRIQEETMYGRLDYNDLNANVLRSCLIRIAHENSIHFWWRLSNDSHVIKFSPVR